MTTARGLILQASHRVLSGPAGPRVPVIHIYGRLEDGGTLLVRDDRQRPHFYIRASDAGRARALRAPEPQAVDKRGFDGDVHWPRPAHKPRRMSRAQYHAVPQQLTLREVKVDGRVLGTTLRDPRAVSKAQFGKLYQRRWHIELDLRRIKTTRRRPWSKRSCGCICWPATRSVC